MKAFILLSALMILNAQSSFAAELEGAKMPDNVTVADKKLTLNGLGLRKVKKFGFHFRVYIGALYLENKSSDSDAIVKNDEIKVVTMHFLRSLSRDQLLEAFETGIENGCFVDCDKRDDQWKLLSPLIVAVREDNEIRFTFYKDKMEYDVNGPNAKHAVIDGSPLAGALSRNTLSMFINKTKPPTEDFRKGVLGIK